MSDILETTDFHRAIRAGKPLTELGGRVGFGMKRWARDVGSRLFTVVIFPEHERYHWPGKDYVQRLLSILNVDCVYDVGANRGQYGRWLRNLGFDKTILSFEPNPTAYEELQKEADRDWLCFPYALGSENGELPFNVMKDDVFSSFRKPSGAVEYAAENTIVSVVKAPVRRLDEVLQEVGQRFRRPFLKIDTQGYDLEVLNGAGRSISKFLGIVSEVAIKRLYANSPTYEESREAFERAGFQSAGMFPVNPYKTLSTIEMNAYFVRRDLTILDPL